MWQNILGHDRIVDRFRRSIAAGRLASTYLFVGPPGVGKRSFAEALAKALLCLDKNASDRLEPCGVCESCRLAAAGNHPDIHVVSRPDDKSNIPLELLIGPKEKRGREGLCHDIAMKPYVGTRRVAIIDDADDLAREGANCLLKTLEEPPPRSVLILVGTAAARQLPTIRSRCQIVRFDLLPRADVAQILLDAGVAETRDEAESLAGESGGSITRAVELADRDMADFRRRLAVRLGDDELNGSALAREVAAVVDAAGKDAPARRKRFKQIISYAAEHYRDAMRASPDSIRAEAAADCLQRCLDAVEQVDRNANQSTLIECWLDDLERATRL